MKKIYWVKEVECIPFSIHQIWLKRSMASLENTISKERVYVSIVAPDLYC